MDREGIFRTALLVGGFPWEELPRAVGAAGGHEAVWRWPATRTGACVPPRRLAAFEAFRREHDPMVMREKVKRSGARVLFRDEPEYPPLLLQIYDPPPVLFVRGTLPDPDRLAVAVVGARRASPYGLAMAEKLGRGLAEAGVTVVSGLAVGIDGAAHRGALAAAGRCQTVAILGTGIDRVYPAEHGRLAREIAERGALVSEFPPGAGPEKWHFPKRNRVLSGSSHGVVVVEARAGSGALITADLGLEQGREVFAVPGRADLPGSFGPHLLLRSGAKLVERVEDILEEFPGRGANSSSSTGDPPTGSPSRPPSTDAGAGGVDPLRGRVLDLLSEGVERLPDLAEHLEAPPGSLERTLLFLELEGTVRRGPGNCYMRVTA